MVDPIGSRPVQTTNRAPAVSAATMARTVESAGSEAARAASTESIRAEAEKAAKATPVDSERVAQIRAAIADGTFPILPAKIADRLIALKLNWVPHDPA